MTEQFNTTILTNALKAVVAPKEGRLQADPFKTLIQNVLSGEFTETMLLPDRAPPKIEEFPDRSDALITQLVSFGDCGGFGLKHLAKLISEVSIRRSNSLLKLLRSALGDLKPEVKTKGIEALFIDVVGIASCYSEVISQPLTHRYEVTVEAIVTNLKVENIGGNTNSGDDDAPAAGQQGASFDDCIMYFVRRIMEEAFQADQSEDILNAEITAVMGSNNKNIQKINVRSMKERRQQVLSILKAATVGEGEISMEIYLKVNHFMSCFNRDSKGNTEKSHTNIPEETTGYIKILRKYRFSYCDNNSNLRRCFSRYPFESLATGVFFEGSHAITYKDVYSKHLKKTNQRQLERAMQSDGNNLKVIDDKMFTSVFFNLIKNIKNMLNQGEYVYAADNLMQLSALMSPNKMNLTFVIARLTQLSNGDGAKIRIIRDAISSLQKISSILRLRILDYVQNKMADEDDDYININHGRMGGGLGFTPRSNSNNGLKALLEDKELELIKTHYHAISEATVEIKLMILALIRDVDYSEFRYVSHTLALEMFQLFCDDKLYPLVNSKLMDKYDLDIEGNNPNANANVNTKPFPGRNTGGITLGNNQFIHDDHGITKKNIESELLNWVSMLSNVDPIYSKLELRLHMLESSISMSILLNLITKDISTAEKSGELDFNRFNYEKSQIIENLWMKGQFDEETFNRRDIRYAVHKWNEAPRTVWEMFGYIESYFKAKMDLYANGTLASARSIDFKINWYLDFDISRGDVGQFHFSNNVKGKDIDLLMKNVLFDPWKNTDNQRLNNDNNSYEKKKDKFSLPTNPDGSRRTLSLWDVNSILRCCSSELVLADMMIDEQNRNETPKFLSSEASRIRYLVETHTLRAIHEALYIAFTSEQVGGDLLLPFHSSVSQTLFKYSSYLHAWNGVPVKTISQYLFSPVRTKNGIKYSEDCCGASVIYTSYRPRQSNLLKAITGGVFGPNRILTGLGMHVQDIFTMSYTLPPIFSSIPISPNGMKLETYVGFSVTTAMQWGLPNHLTSIDTIKSKLYKEALKHEKESMLGNVTSFKDTEEALRYKPSHKVVDVEYHPIPVEIEIILKYTMLASGEQYARRSFGSEVSKCVHYLSSGQDYRIQNVEAFSSIEDKNKKLYDKTGYSGGSGSGSGNGNGNGSDGKPSKVNRLIFDKKGIIEDKDYDLSMQNVISRYGYATIDCAVSLPEYKSGMPTLSPSENDDIHNDHCTLNDTIVEDNDNKVLSLGLLSQALEKTVKKASLLNDEYYDPCKNDHQRVCETNPNTNSVSNNASACSIIQDYIKKKGYPKSLVPCKISFTMLCQTPSGIHKANTNNTSINRGNNNSNNNNNNNNINNEESDNDTLGELYIGNHHLPRLVASTIWLSSEAANGIWSCVRKIGDVKECYNRDIITKQNEIVYLNDSGLYMDVIERSKIICLLKLEYNIYTKYVRYNTSLATKLRKLLFTINMCRNILEAGDPTTMDISVLRHTMVKYICLSLRLCLLSPQCVHMRGGCQLIFTQLLSLEALLKLAPIPLKLTQPVTVVAGTKDDKGTGKYRSSGHVITSAEASWDVNELRKAIGVPAIVTEAAEILFQLETTCNILLEASAKDIDLLIKEEDIYQKLISSQSYQILDSRDIVNKNDEKIKNAMNMTFDIQKSNQDASMFDKDGNIKPDATLSSLLKDTSTASFGQTLAAQTAAAMNKVNGNGNGNGDTMKSDDDMKSLISKSTADSDDGSDSGSAGRKENNNNNNNNTNNNTNNEQNLDEIELKYKNIITKQLNSRNVMACVLGDLDNEDRRNAWIDREKEFSFTKTGKLLVLKKIDEEKAAEAAALRNKRKSEAQSRARGVGGGGMGMGGGGRKPSVTGGDDVLNSVSKLRGAVKNTGDD